MQAALTILGSSHIRACAMWNSALSAKFPATGPNSPARTGPGYSCPHSSLFFSTIRNCAIWNSALAAKFPATGPQFTRADWDTAPRRAQCRERGRASRGVCRGLWWKQYPVMDFPGRIDPAWLGANARVPQAVGEGLGSGWTASEKCGTFSRRKDQEHDALVRRVTPKERLLEYESGEGWEPLCAFS